MRPALGQEVISKVQRSKRLERKDVRITICTLQCTGINFTLKLRKIRVFRVTLTVSKKKTRLLCSRESVPSASPSRLETPPRQQPAGGSHTQKAIARAPSLARVGNACAWRLRKSPALLLLSMRS